jgi:transposase
MQAVTTIGLESVFQILGVDAVGNVIVRRQLKRRFVLAFFQKLPRCLMPPAYVKPYVKRHKSDAEPIYEAVTRANMRFVATKTPEQQSCLMLHRAIAGTACRAASATI